MKKISNLRSSSSSSKFIDVKPDIQITKISLEVHVELVSPDI